MLDAGAGNRAWNCVLRRRAERVVAVDLHGPSAGVAADLRQLPFADETFDAALCTQVVEHIPDPEKALTEIRRVIKTGGAAVVTAPHLSRVHDAPADYYRFTIYGLRAKLEEAGWQVVTVQPAGGLLSFLGHNLYSVFLSLISKLPIAREVAVYFARATSPLWYYADRVLDPQGFFAASVAAVARKDGSQR